MSEYLGGNKLTPELEVLKSKYKYIFGRLNSDEEKTIEFYYKMGLIRGVDSFKYVIEAIDRASIKKDLHKPICYVAGLLKNFYKKGLYSQQSHEELDVLFYIESKIGNLNDRNRDLIISIISTSGTTRLMAAIAEVLNNSSIQDKIIDEILLQLTLIWNLNTERK